ncbi:MAG: MBOAT family protein, partial [Oscillospiraceae bacterium]|nr:MBOAT family protein [Oscillospiraceae bacterium]
WRRWHISLGTWFREYVYIPLGGNRCSKARNFLNIFIVWMLTGIWHGAAWNFLLWGIYYALLLMLEKLVLLKWLKKAPALLTHIYTMFLVVVGWAIFANEGLGQCGTYLATMFFCSGGPVFLPSDAYYLANYAVVLILCAVASVPAVSTLMKKLPEAVRTVAAPVLIAAGLLLCTAYLVDATYNPFLYFRF